MPQLEGVDVSHHEGQIDWQRIRDAGIAFAFIKATQGNTFIDPAASDNLTACRAAGIAPSMYHFYRHDIDPEAQAAFFLQNIGPCQAGDLPPTVDVEETGDGAGPINPMTKVVDRVGAFVQAVRAGTGCAPIIYTYPAAWRDLTDNSNRFANDCPLWIASYQPSAPQLIGGWTDYTFWQYTDHGNVPGIDGSVDRDRFNGGQAELDALRIGMLMQGGTAVLNQDGTVRDGQGLSATPIAVLPGGSRVTIVDGPNPANGRNWWKVDAGNGTTGWCSGALLSPA